MNYIIMAVIILWWVALALVLAWMSVTHLSDKLDRHLAARESAAYNRGLAQAEDRKEWKALTDCRERNAALIQENNQLRKKVFPGKC